MSPTTTAPGNGAATPDPPMEELTARSPADSPDSIPEVAAIVRQATGRAVDAMAGPAPSRDPAQIAAGIGETAGKITHLYSYDNPTGAWVFLDGIGWKRIAPASQHGHHHMTVLASIATHANLPVYYNLNAAGEIDRLYV